MKLNITLAKEQAINQFVIQEDIAKGHRVKRFTIEALVTGKWKTIIKGSAIGNKYIQLLDKPVIAKKFRLKIDDVFAEPDITKFAVYHVNSNNNSNSQ